ncbi:hypothetical protein N9Q18_01030 [bacterium]|nr:hypothetical protein [bacterium]
MSSWPQTAISTYTMMKAVLSKTRDDQNDGLTTPLSDLWRVYEAWSVYQVLDVLRADPRVRALDAMGSAAGCEWFQQLEGPTGRIIAVAQPEISDDPDRCGPLMELGLVSITSVLEPDLLVVFENQADKSWMIDVYDAKKRRSSKRRPRMSAGDVAEAASKYVWGLRMPSKLQPAVRTVSILSPETPEGMFDSASQIETFGLRPGVGVDGLTNVVRNRLPT